MGTMVAFSDKCIVQRKAVFVTGMIRICGSDGVERVYLAKTTI